MKRNKLLALAVAALCSASSWAQTDVTSRYLVNADFSEGTPITVGTTTYDYDMEKNGTTFCNLVPVAGWDIPDNGNARAGGLIAFGSGVWIGGPGYNCPSTNADGESKGNILGLVGVWTGQAQYTQDVTLPAGTFTLVLGVYNSVGGTDAFAKNLIGFIENGGTEHLATTTVYPVNKWKFEFITFTLGAETSGKISLGYKGSNVGSAKAQHLFLSGIQLFDGEVDAAAYEEAKQLKLKAIAWSEAVAAAKETLASDDYAVVIGQERAILEEELKKAEPTTLEGYDTALDDLNTAQTNFTSAKTAYEAIVDANMLAADYGLQGYTVTSSSTVEEINAAIDAINAAVQGFKHDANVKQYDEVEANFPYEVALGAWTMQGNVKNEKGQHWSGDATITYNEPNYWGTSTGGEATWQQEITLPAGSYVLKLAGRRSAAMTLTASVVSGEELLGMVDDFNPAGTGRGIDVYGNANFSDEGEYANNGTGWGFEWRFLPFTLSEEATVTVLIETRATTGQQWASFCDYVIKAQNKRAALKGAIDAAARVDLSANVGTGVFQKETDAPAIWEKAIKDAQKVYENPSASVNAINTAIENLNADVEFATEEWNNTLLNQPNDGQLFNLVLTFGGYQYDNKAVTYIAGGRADAGGYSIAYQAEPNTNLAQAFTLTWVEDDNYLLSQVDADGNVRYVCTGTIYGGNDAQLRTTLNEDEAAVFTVKATSRDGVYNLWNVAAQQYVGSQDNGFYTVNSHIDFNIVETSKASVNVKTTGGWGTVILPFAAEVPAGVEAYVVEGFNGTDVEMTAVDELAANTPYLLIGSVNVTLTGDAQGTAIVNKVEGNLLTGVYAETLVPAGSYVKDGNHFAIVTEGEEVSVAANEAYLTYPLAEGEEPVEVITAIRTIAAQAQPVNGAIFNLAGQQVSKAVKGIYVQGGKKVVVK